MNHKYERVVFNGVRQYRHRVIAELVLGRPLRGEECVHHVDGNHSNNSHNNLVICPSAAYHKLLHTRTEALQVCRDPDGKRCYICKEYDDPHCMTFISRGKDSFYYHRRCATENYERNKETILANRQRRRAAGKRN